MGPPSHNLRLMLFAAVFQIFSLGSFLHADGTPVQLADLNGTWRMVELAGEPVPHKPKIFFRLEDELLSGFDGCNRFSGPVAQPEKIRSIGRGCTNDQMRLPLDLKNPMEHLSSFKLIGGELTLPTADNSTAVFLKEEE